MTFATYKDSLGWYAVTMVADGVRYVSENEHGVRILSKTSAKRFRTRQECRDFCKANINVNTNADAVVNVAKLAMNKIATAKLHWKDFDGLCRFLISNKGTPEAREYARELYNVAINPEVDLYEAAVLGRLNAPLAMLGHFG